MSSILKALRKLEEEKAALGEGRVDLARDILKRSAPHRRPSSTLPLKIIFFCIVVIAMGGLLWWQLRTVEQDPVTLLTIEQRAIPAAVTPQPVPQNDGTEVMAVPVDPVAESVRPQSSILPPAETVAAATKRPTAAEPVVAAEPDTPLAIEPAPVAKEETAPLIEPQPAPAEAPLVVGSTPAQEQVQPQLAAQPLPDDLPELRVDLIVFRPEPEQRLAMINDLPVMEGTDVEGVRIVEIQKQRVRVSWQGEEFSLPLNK